MLHNMKPVYLHCVFHGIRFKVNEDWESGKIPFFYALIFPMFMFLELKGNKTKKVWRIRIDSPYFLLFNLSFI